MGIAHVHFGNMRTNGAQRVGNGGAGFQGNFTLGAGAAQQNGDEVGF